MAFIKAEEGIFEKPFPQYTETANGSFVACYGRFVIPIRPLDEVGVEEIREVIKAPKTGECKTYGELRKISSGYYGRKIFKKESN